MESMLTFARKADWQDHPWARSVINYEIVYQHDPPLCLPRFFRIVARSIYQVNSSYTSLIDRVRILPVDSKITKMKQIKYQLEVGIDVAKSSLRVAVGDTQMEVKNSKGEILKMLNKLKKQSPFVRVTCESTGGYEDLLISLCLEKGVAVSQCNPVHIKHFIRSHGKYAKTDAIDAHYIAKYATERSPQVLDKRWLAVKQRREIQQRIDFLTKENARRKACLDGYSDKSIIAEIKREISSVKKKIEKHRAELQKLIKLDPVLEKTRILLESVVGVGTVTSTTLINTLPELGTVNRQEIARLTGLAPLHFESGNYKGVRKIYGGRARPRTALYMAAVVALRHNPELKSFGARLRDAGKAGRAIVVAVARKLLIHLNSLVKKEIYGI